MLHQPCASCKILAITQQVRTLYLSTPGTDPGKRGAKSSEFRTELEKCGVTSTPTSGAVRLDTILSQDKSHLRLQTATNKLAKPSDLPLLEAGLLLSLLVLSLRVTSICQ